MIVLDADSLAYKRMWGAYGKPPTDMKLPNFNPASPQFANPVHCVKIANDGLVYVCDRSNDRIQVFQKNGTFVKEFESGRKLAAPDHPMTSRSGPTGIKPG